MATTIIHRQRLAVAVRVGQGGQHLRQQHVIRRRFGAASGVAVIGAVFYGRLGDVPSRGGSVSAMVLAMVIDAVIVLAAAGLTLLLPRRAAGRRTAVPRERAAEYAPEAVH